MYPRYGEAQEWRSSWRLYRFRDKDFGDATGILLAVVYFFVAGPFSGYPQGTPWVPLPFAFGAMFLGMGLLWFALGNYALDGPEKYVRDTRFTLPVLLSIGVYIPVAIVALLLEPSGFWILLVFLGAGAGAMWSASRMDHASGVTTIHLLGGMAGTMLFGIFLSSFVGVAFGFPPGTLFLPPSLMLIAVAMFFSTVFADWAAGEGGIVGYFGGTDALFYAFALTSFFVTLGVLEMVGWAP